MKLSAAKKGTTRYFTAKLGWKEQFDPKEIELLASGAVPALIPPIAVQGRKNNVIDYDITPFTTLEFYLSCILSREQFVELLLQFTELFRAMQAVYLNYKNLVLDVDQIYIALQDRSLHMIYLPLRDSKRDASIPDFLRKLSRKVNRSTYEQVTFLNELTAFLDRPGAFTLNEFERLLRPAAQTPVQPAVQETLAAPGGGIWYTPPAPVHTPAAPPAAAPNHTPAAVPVQAQAPAAFAAAPAAPQAAPSAAVPVAPPAVPPIAIHPPVPVPPAPGAEPNCGGTVILDAPGGTILLGEAEPTPQPRAFLVRKSTGSRVEIHGGTFRIGKEAGQVDYCIGDNPTISRSHAEIVTQEGVWLIRDLGSTNKTYLNGVLLPPHQLHPLENGAALRLANEEFTFTLEG